MILLVLHAILLHLYYYVKLRSRDWRSPSCDTAVWNFRAEKKKTAWLVFSFVPRFHYYAITLLRYYATQINFIKRIIKIMKVYIERNKLQLELIRCTKFFFFYLLLRSDGLNAISPTNWGPKSAPEILAYSLHGRCSWHAYQSFEHKPVRSLSFLNGNTTIRLIIYSSLRF